MHVTATSILQSPIINKQTRAMTTTTHPYRVILGRFNFIFILLPPLPLAHVILAVSQMILGAEIKAIVVR